MDELEVNYIANGFVIYKNYFKWGGMDTCNTLIKTMKKKFSKTKRKHNKSNWPVPTFGGFLNKFPS